MNEKDKIKLLIGLVLAWVIVFTLRSIFFSQEIRRVPLKYTNSPSLASKAETAVAATEELPALIHDGEKEISEFTLKEVKNIFAPLPFYIPPPPPPKPEPPPPPPEPPPEPHPLEKVLEEIEFTGNATKNNQLMVFLTYHDELFQVSEGSTFMEDQLEVSEITEDKLRIRIKGTEIEKEIYFQ